jgi:hypothetical protein
VLIAAGRLRAQKNRRDDLRQIGGLRVLTRPQAPVRRIGKIIPTGKAAKRLAERIHWESLTFMGVASSQVEGNIERPTSNEDFFEA